MYLRETKAKLIVLIKKMKYTANTFCTCIKVIICIFNLIDYDVLD